MNTKLTIKIITKLCLIMMVFLYLPTYTLQNAKVFKAMEVKDQEVNAPVSSKKIYIYNTHQGEEYVGYNVLQGADDLKSSLEKLGYPCTREQNDFENYKNVHGIPYNQSYTVSKMYLENALNDHGQYDLLIDFHRDSLDKKYSTLTYQNKNYAKIMFVVGRSSGKFEETKQLSEWLSSHANEYVQGISKGVMIKKNTYNQGICDHTVLIEFGGQSNTKEEVLNTIDIMSHVIKDYLQ